MQKSPKVAMLEVMANATHHQRGAGCSTTPEIRSVNQLKLRRCSTSGTRVSCCSGSLIVSGAVGAPSMLYGRSICGLRADKMSMFLFLIPAISVQNLRPQCFPRRASSGLDCECARGNLLVGRRSNNREFGNSDPAVSFLTHGFLDP